MLSHQKAVNYAKALFDVEGSLIEVQARQTDLELIADLVKQEPRILTFLSFPDLATDKKIEVLEKILEKKIDPCVARLIACVIERRKTSAIKQIASEYRQLVVHTLKEIDVDVETAVPLTAEERDSLKLKLENKFQKKVNLLEHMDPALLGGFTIVVHNEMLDLSIRAKLINLKKQLLKAEL